MSLTIDFATSGGQKRFLKYVERFRQANKELNDHVKEGACPDRLRELLDEEKTLAFLLTNLVTDTTYADISEIKSD